MDHSGGSGSGPTVHRRQTKLLPSRLPLSFTPVLRKSLCRLTGCSSQLPTLALPTDEPVSLVAGAGVATSCVDADLGGVTVMRVGFTFIDVCKERRRTAVRKLGTFLHMIRRRYFHSALCMCVCVCKVNTHYAVSPIFREYEMRRREE